MISNSRKLYHLLNPRRWIFHLAHRWLYKEQEAVRKAIDIKWQGAVPQGVYWRNEDPLDAQKLNMGEHGSQEWKIKRAFHSLLSNYGADRLHFDRTYKYLPLLILLVPILDYTFGWAVRSAGDYVPMVTALWTTLAVMVGLLPWASSVWFWRMALPSKIATKEEEDASLNVLSRCLLRLRASKNVPEDVNDVYRVGDIDSEGDSVVGQIVAADMDVSALQIQVRETKVVFLLAALILLFAVWFPTTATLFGISLKGKVLTLFVFLLIMYELSQPSPAQLRAKVMDKAAKQSATEYLRDSAGRAYWQNIERAKNQQQINASRDQSPLFEVGKATGILASRRDPFAPCTENMPACLSQNDLSTHLFVLGASGTGKTSGVIRPLVFQWLKNKSGGMLVLDGKGQLADELIGAKGYQVISPEQVDYNAIEGLYPEDVADAFFHLFASKGKENGKDVFDSSARTAILNAAVLLHESDRPYTIQGISELFDDEELRDELIRGFIDSGSKQFLVAGTYWLDEYANYTDRIKSSILVTVKSWLSPILQNRFLDRWNDCEKGEKVEGVLDGCLIGLSLPEAKYGVAGALVSMLAMRRLYQAAKLRGDSWKAQGGQQVLMVADEVQNLVSLNDIEIVPIARSLGLSMFWSTQNIDGLYQKIGEEESKQLLGNFANVLSFSSRTEKSDEWLSKRVGQVWRAVVEGFNGFPDSKFSVDSLVHSGTAKKTHATPNELLIRRNIRMGRLGHVAGSEDQLYGAYSLHNFFRFLLRLPMPDEPDMKEPYAEVQVKPAHIVEAEEVDSLLSNQWLALMVFRRAGVIRRDVIEVNPMFSFEGVDQ